MNAPLVINDPIELWVAIDAGGIHVGGTDIYVAAVRARRGKGKIIGPSCYDDLQPVRDPVSVSVSYVVFSGFYPYRVKKYVVTSSPDITSYAISELNVPICVI